MPLEYLAMDCLIDTDTSVVVNIIGLGEANNGVDEDIYLVLACGTSIAFLSTFLICGFIKSE